MIQKFVLGRSCGTSSSGRVGTVFSSDRATARQKSLQQSRSSATSSGAE